MPESSPTIQVPVAEESIPKIKTTPILVKSLILLLLAVLMFVLCKFTPLKQWFLPASKGAEWFRSLGAQGIVLFIATSALLILVGVPRLLLCTVAGALYDFWGGLGFSLIATMISYYIGFIWIRGRRHKGMDASELPKGMAFLAGDPGFTGVVIGRVLPAPGMVVTMALALSNVNIWTYLIGSVIGLIPEAVPMVLAGVAPDDYQRLGKLTGVAVLGIAAGWLVIRFFAARFKAKQTKLL